MLQALDMINFVIEIVWVPSNSGQRLNVMKRDRSGVFIPVGKTLSDQFPLPQTYIPRYLASYQEL